MWQTIIHCVVLLYSFIRIVNRNIALLYCIYYLVERSTGAVCVLAGVTKTQSVRLLLYRWMEMIVNDIHAHTLCTVALL